MSEIQQETINPDIKEVKSKKSIDYQSLSEQLKAYAEDLIHFRNQLKLLEKSESENRDKREKIKIEEKEKNKDKDKEKEKNKEKEKEKERPAEKDSDKKGILSETTRDYFEYYNLMAIATHAFLDTCKRYNFLHDTEKLSNVDSNIRLSISDSLRRIHKALEDPLLETVFSRDQSAIYKSSEKYQKACKFLSLATQDIEELTQDVNVIFDKISEYPDLSKKVSLEKERDGLNAIFGDLIHTLLNPKNKSLEITDDKEKDKKNISRKKIVGKDYTLILPTDEIITPIEGFYNTNITDNLKEISTLVDDFIGFEKVGYTKLRTKEIVIQQMLDKVEELIETLDGISPNTEGSKYFYKDLENILEPIKEKFPFHELLQKQKITDSLSKVFSNKNVKPEDTAVFLLEFQTLLLKTIQEKIKLNLEACKKIKIECSKWRAVLKSVDILEKYYLNSLEKVAKMHLKIHDYLEYLELEPSEREKKRQQILEKQKTEQRTAALERTVDEEKEKRILLEQKLEVQEKRIDGVATGLTPDAAKYLKDEIEKTPILNEYYKKIYSTLDYLFNGIRSAASGLVVGNSDDKFSGAKYATAIANWIPLINNFTGPLESLTSKASEISQADFIAKLKLWVPESSSSTNFTKELAVRLTQINKKKILASQEKPEEGTLKKVLDTFRQVCKVIDELQSREKLTDVEMLAKGDVTTIVAAITKDQSIIPSQAGEDQRFTGNLTSMLSLFDSSIKIGNSIARIPEAEVTQFEKMGVRMRHFVPTPEESAAPTDNPEEICLPPSSTLTFTKIILEKKEKKEKITPTLQFSLDSYITVEQEEEEEDTRPSVPPKTGITDRIKEALHIGGKPGGQPEEKPKEKPKKKPKETSKETSKEKPKENTRTSVFLGMNNFFSEKSTPKPQPKPQPKPPTPPTPPTERTAAATTTTTPTTR